MCAIFGITSYDYIKSHPYYIYVKNQIKDIPGLRKSEINILDGCYHVYLDVGSNIGVQVRKLYEPRKYPDAYVHEIFDFITKFFSLFVCICDFYSIKF